MGLPCTIITMRTRNWRRCVRTRSWYRAFFSMLAALAVMAIGQPSTAAHTPALPAACEASGQSTIEILGTIPGRLALLISNQAYPPTVGKLGQHTRTG